MLSARSKAARLAFVKSIAHRIFLIVVISMPPQRPSPCRSSRTDCTQLSLAIAFNHAVACPFRYPFGEPALHPASTAARHWRETSPRGPDRFRPPPFLRSSHARLVCRCRVDGDEKIVSQHLPSAGL